MAKLPVEEQWVDTDYGIVLVNKVLPKVNFWIGKSLIKNNIVYGSSRGWRPIIYYGFGEIKYPFCWACNRCFHLDGMFWPFYEEGISAFVCDRCYCEVPLNKLLQQLRKVRS